MNKLISVAGLYIRSVVKRLAVVNIATVAFAVLFILAEYLLRTDIRIVIKNYGRLTLLVIPVFVLTLLVLCRPFDSARDCGQGMLRRLRIDINEISMIEGVFAGIIFFLTWKLWIIIAWFQDLLLIALYADQINSIGAPIAIFQTALAGYLYPYNGFGITQYLICIMAGIIAKLAGHHKLSADFIKKIGT